jgi:ribosomal protein S18 acetylase RimI-like enzyme
VNVVPADTLSVAEIAELFTRGYEGYYVPVQVDEASMRYMIDTWDIDLARSRVAENVGFCNLAVRGDRGWIGGIAIVSEARRRGTGRRLMEAVLEVAPPIVTLEVLEQNEPAIRLYEELGFERTRILEVWSVKETPLVEAHPVEPAPLGGEGLPWQREDASLPPGGYERLELDGGAVLVRGTNVLQLTASDDDTATALLSRGAPPSRWRADAQAVRDAVTPLRSAPRG